MTCLHTGTWGYCSTDWSLINNHHSAFAHINILSFLSISLTIFLVTFDDYTPLTLLLGSCNLWWEWNHTIGRYEVLIGLPLNNYYHFSMPWLLLETCLHQLGGLLDIPSIPFQCHANHALSTFLAWYVFLVYFFQLLIISFDLWRNH